MHGLYTRMDGGSLHKALPLDEELQVPESSREMENHLLFIFFLFVFQDQTLVLSGQH